MNLRKHAKGKPCMIRLPGCTHSVDETRLAHLRMAGITGGGQKAPDALGAWACHYCAMVTESGYAESDAVKVAFFEGVMRTQYALIKAGILKW